MSDDEPTLRRLRVVHLTTTDMSLDWLLRPQLEAFGQAGYEVIGMSAAGPHVEQLAASGIRHVDVPAFTRSNNPLQDIRAFGQLLRLLRTLRPDILHTHNPKPGILGRIAGRLTRTPLIVNTQHGLWAQPSDRMRRRLPVYAAERIAAAFGHVELVQNPEDVDTLVDTLRIPRRKVRLLGNGIDLVRFDRDRLPADTRSRLRSEWGVHDDDVVCLVVGRLVREKGIVELLEAARLLSHQNSSIRFVVVGPSEPDKSDGADEAMLEQASADGVVFTGTRTDIPECYVAADIFIAASWREGFPRSAMEAAAMGLPTVASDVRGNRQVVQDGETGLLVAVRDSSAIAAAVAGLAGDPDRRASMGAAARTLSRAEFDQQRVIERTLDAYQLFGR